MTAAYGQSDVLQRDLEELVHENAIFEQYKDATVLISGATGLIGSLLIRSFVLANEQKHLNVKIIALIRDENKAGTIFGDLLERSDIEVLKVDICTPLSCRKPVDFIFHTAAITTSKTMVELPVMTAVTAIYGTKNMLDFAVKVKAKAFVYISSMEVYGKFLKGELVSEAMMGYVNPLLVRSNYPESKRMCENLCIAYQKQYGVPVKIARLAQVFGAGILPGENRVFAQFARSVIHSTDIVLHTQGLSDGNYCYTTDCIRGLLLIATDGVVGEAYNVANEESHITIADMAQLVAEKLAQGRIQVCFDIPDDNVYGYAEDTKMILSADKLKGIGWEPRVSLEESYRRMISYMREMYQGHQMA